MRKVRGVRNESGGLFDYSFRPCHSVIAAGVGLALTAIAAPLFAAPDIDGLVYSTGELDTEYNFFQESTANDGSAVYIAIDGSIISFALVNSVYSTDTVCGRNKTYVNSVGWGNGRLGGGGGCRQAINSEYARFRVSCGNGLWDFDIASAYPRDSNGAWVSPDSVAGHENYTWHADPFEVPGEAVSMPPSGIESASTISWNFNNSHLNGSGFDLSPGDGSVRTFGSPDIEGDDDLLNGTNPDEYLTDVLDNGIPDGDGYLVVGNNGNGNPATGATYWEWPLTYEFSFNTSDCVAGSPVVVSIGESHNSPLKDSDDTDIPFEGDKTLRDFGDNPDSYGTDLVDSAGEGIGAYHDYVVGGGLLLGTAYDTEADAVPSTDSNSDDNSGADEDGVAAFPTPPTQIKSGDSYVVSVNVTNTTAASAELCGWMDFDLNGGAGDGVFDADERACVTVPQNTAGDDSTPECTDNQDGTFTCNVTFTVPGDFTPAAEESTYARFRLGSSFAEVSSPTGAATDGEVEDYIVPASSMPVSLSSFESRLTGSSLSVEWTTASETFNVGFDIWTRVDDEWRRLTEEPILSKAVDAVTPGEYRARLSLKDIDPASIQGLALSTIETTGGQELYGTFEVGESYGDQALPEPIAWDVVRAEHDATMRDKGYEKRGGKWRQARRNGAANGAAASDSAMEVLVSEPGMQRLTYEDLESLGMDLAGLRPNAIAVTLKGEAVARRIEPGRGNGLLGPGGYIDFWGKAPDFPDALYVSEYVYRVEVNPEKAQRADRQMRRVRDGQQQALHPLRVNEDVSYSFVNATEDPWHAAMLMYPWGPRSYSASVDVDDALVTGEPGRVEVRLTAFSDFPKVDPDHRVRLLVNGELVEEEDISGHRAVTMTANVPAGVITAGSNTVTVELPGGTEAPFDIVTVDTVTFWYPRWLTAADNRLLVEGELTAQGLQARGFNQSDIAAYAHSGTGNLYELRADAKRSKGSWEATVATISEPGEAQYWVSGSSSLIRPEPLGMAARADLLAEPADFLLIVHPAFLPDDGDASHPLNRYISHRENQGWTVRAVGIDAIQNNYGGGMPLPDAVTRFLAAAEKELEYSHVLLVGDDSYDYLDKLGLGSVSFVPTMYADTNLIHHSPSDGLMTDLDGDGLSDKAVGRWPVRSLTDLEVMVQKTLDWEDTLDGPRDNRTSVWVTDSADPSVPSFDAQAERMIETLLTPLAGDAGEAWPEDNITRIYWDSVEPLPSQSISRAARAQLMEALSQGQTVTGFAGHGSPTSWTFQGLLNAAHVKEMDNEGLPTMISTLTCYTTYFVSPYTNTLAHRLMSGYRVDGQGKQIPGAANGAVAVQGAATLSGYTDNENLARTTLRHQLEDGDTLGEAIRKARQAAAATGQVDTATNWALLGDPTLTIEP